MAPPRAGGHKVGVFASRAPYRPNAIGLSLVKILKIDHDNGQVEVENCDLVNETPILGEFNLRSIFLKYEFKYWALIGQPISLDSIFN